MKQISNAKKKRLKEQWTEVQLFEKRFNQLESIGKNYCVITWKTIQSFEDTWPSNYAHILSKSTFPEFRYHLNNIALVLWEKHEELDEKVIELMEKIWRCELVKIIESWEEVLFDLTY
jgi:hypothetical protein